MEAQPIGILDSGVGGLSVARAILDLLPGESIVYYADTAHFPYGERTPTEVQMLCARGVRRLAGLRSKCVVVACNSASASALDCAARPASLPVFDMLSRSSLGETLRQLRGARIGLIATSLTVSTGAYQELLEHLARPCELFALPVPRLVRLVEAGGADSAEAIDLVETDLAPLRPLGLDALILGCTHFSFLKEPIRKAVGPSVTLIDPSRLVARAVAQALHAGGLTTLASSSRSPFAPPSASVTAHQVPATGGSSTTAVPPSGPSPAGPSPDAVQSGGVGPAALAPAGSAAARTPGGGSPDAGPPAAGAPAAGSRPHRLIVTDGRADRIIAAGKQLGLLFERVEVDPEAQLPGYDREGALLHDSGGTECRGW